MEISEKILKAAEAGDPKALCELGEYFYEKKEYEKAFGSYQAAAEQGVAEAQYMVARCYATGRGVEPSAEKSLYWCQEAANQDYASARNCFWAMEEMKKLPPIESRSYLKIPFSDAFLEFLKKESLGKQALYARYSWSTQKGFFPFSKERPGKIREDMIQSDSLKGFLLNGDSIIGALVSVPDGTDSPIEGSVPFSILEEREGRDPETLVSELLEKNEQKDRWMGNKVRLSKEFLLKLAQKKTLEEQIKCYVLYFSTIETSHRSSWLSYLALYRLAVGNKYLMLIEDGILVGMTFYNTDEDDSEVCMGGCSRLLHEGATNICGSDWDDENHYVELYPLEGPFFDEE